MKTLWFILFCLSFHLFSPCAKAQDWVSYRSPGQINDLIDNGSELLLATDAGLVVLDKTTLEFTLYNKANANLSNDHLQSITRAPDGSFWIGTYDVVLARFDGSDFTNTTSPATEAFLPGTQLYDLEFAPNGDLWVGTTEGIFRRQGTTWQHYGEAELDTPFAQAWDLEINPAGEVFVGSRDVHLFAGDTWSKLSDTTQFIGYADAELFFAANGDLYVAGDLNRVFRFDGTQWRAYEITDFNAGEIVGFTEDPFGNVYFNALNDGVYQLVGDVWVRQDDPQTAAFDRHASYFHVDDEDRHWLNYNVYLSVREDAEIRTASISEHTLEYNEIEDVHRGRNDHLYFLARTSSNGIPHVDPEGQWFSLPLPTAPLLWPAFGAIVVFADDDIWLSTFEGLHHYDGAGWTFEAAGFFTHLVGDDQGRLYAANVNRIRIIENGTSSEYTTGNSPLTGAATLSGLGVDADGYLWIAARAANVIQRVSPAGDWTTYTAAEHPALAQPDGDFHFDAAGNAWIPSAQGGALKFDGQTWTNPLLEDAEGIDDVNVFSIATDAWGTHYFAYRYGVISETAGEWDLLRISEIEENGLFHESVITFDADGTLWWAGENDGVYAYTPDAPSSVIGTENSRLAPRIYPNPTQGIFTVDARVPAAKKVTIYVHNGWGQVVAKTVVDHLPQENFRHTFDLSGFPSGIYTLIMDIDGRTLVSRVVIG